jgi:hypothetical protein
MFVIAIDEMAQTYSQQPTVLLFMLLVSFSSHELLISGLARAGPEPTTPVLLFHPWLLTLPIHRQLHLLFRLHTIATHRPMVACNEGLPPQIAVQDIETGFD